MVCSLGIDIGSVGLKVVLLDPSREPLGMWRRPIRGRRADVLSELLSEIRPSLGEETLVRVGVTGSGRDGVPGEGISSENEVVATARALRALFRGAMSAIEIGGHGARWVLLDRATRGLADYGLNQQCAAGSGAFFEQQAGRLGLSVEDFAEMAAGAARGATVAGRCSVFAKSDMIHLQQKGTPPEEIAYGLCLAMARNFVATVLSGRKVVAPVAVTGGCAANAGLVRAFKEVLHLDDESLRVSPCPGNEGALGAALGAARREELEPVPWSEIAAFVDLKEPERRRSDLAPLEIGTASAAGYTTPPPPQPCEVFLGVDVGSVSTNLVVMGRDGEVHEGVYLPTRGRPVEALAEGLERLQRRFAGHDLVVLGVGVTGSGRHLAASLLGADLVRNEITCQLRGTTEVVPDADTIFEIGGQDSKYISVSGGRIRDFTMNKICAAGTGSFLEEQADHLGVDVITEFAPLAGRSCAPADLGCQCTVFMQSELVAAQLRGKERGDLCGGLAYSVARNYLHRVVAGRPIGDKIVFQGGTASNAAVVAAFEKILGRSVSVHPFNRVSGAIGAAHLVRDERPERSRFRGFDACEVEEARGFECEACENRCQVNRIRIDGRAVHFGDACERFSAKDAEGAGAERSLPDPLTLHRELIRPFLVPPQSPRGSVGMPLSSVLVDQVPFWATFFSELGYRLVLSKPSSSSTLEGGQQSLPAETCLPVKLSFGHLVELAEEGVEQVFLPSFLTLTGEPGRSYPCPYVQALPFMAGAALDISLLTPEVDLGAEDAALLGSLGSVFEKLGVSRVDALVALGAAREAQRTFGAQRVEAGRQLLEGCERALVVVGKPYNVLDPYLNLNLFQHLSRLGVTALPMWFLPLSEVSLDGRFEKLPWAHSRDMLRAVEICLRDRRLFPVLVSSFGCGTDAFTQKHIEQMLEGEHWLGLEFDEHRAEAGLVTRLEAFVDELDQADRGAAAGVEVPAISAAPSCSAVDLDGPRSFVIPYFSDHAYAFSGAFQAVGHEARVLPPPDERTRQLGEAQSSGKECHPYTMLAGDLLDVARSERPGGEVFLIPGTEVPCLMHQYGDGHRLTLKRLGVDDLDVLSPNAADLQRLLGIDGGTRLWRGLVAVDQLILAQCATRPYELEPGMTDEVHRQNVRDVEVALACGDLDAALTMAAARLQRVPVDRSRTRPLVGVAGDVYTRINHVANEELFRWLEAHGCEVWPASFMVDIVDFSWRRDIGRDLSRGNLATALLSGALMLRKDYSSRWVKRRLSPVARRAGEPGFKEVLELAAPYVGEDGNEILILNVAKMVDFARRGADGVVNAMGLNCMLGTVSAAVARRVRDDYGGLPVANLVYGGGQAGHRTALEAFVHQVHERRGGNARAA